MFARDINQAYQRKKKPSGSCINTTSSGTSGDDTQGKQGRGRRMTTRKRKSQ